MQTYRNLGGGSNIARYEIAADSITLELKSGTRKQCLYDGARPGARHVEKLKELALAGRGLDKYIDSYLSSPGFYARKW